MFNRLLFADDLVLIASSEQVLQHALVWDAVRKKIYRTDSTQKLLNQTDSLNMFRFS